MFIEEARIAHYSHSQYIIIGEKDLEEIIQNEYVLEEIKRAGKL